MSANAAFQRKVIYLSLLALLIYPLWWLSAPAVSGGNRPESGGKLARMRKEYKLSQASLGEIDPASESMKLASLGLNGVAVNLLSQKAFEYKMVEDYDNLYATLNQIRHLQSNFISIFEFQGHNISYNVSAELDNYRHRYYWVKRGIKFLIDGIAYNQHEPRLQWNLGWFCGEKIGRADEHELFRELFRDDRDFHAELEEAYNSEQWNLAYSKADNKPDNWLVARLWYLQAEELVDLKGAELRGKSPLVFYSFPAKMLINYASASEDEGNVGETAKEAWREAGIEWNEYGGKPIPTSWGHNLRLNYEEQMREEYAKLLQQLDNITPGVRERLEKERRDSLSKEQRMAMETPVEERDSEQFVLASEAEQHLKITADDIAAAAPAEVRDDAAQLAAKANDRQLLADRIARYRQTVNYEYWRDRCLMEQQDLTLHARRMVIEAEKAFHESDLVGAQEKYEQAWTTWAAVFEEFPQMRGDVTGQDLMIEIKRYFELVNRHLGQSVPADFPLRELLEMHDKNLLAQLSTATSESESPSEPPADDADPPADNPPAENSPADEPPADEPPAENSPADELPAENPPPPDESPTEPDRSDAAPVE